MLLALAIKLFIFLIIATAIIQSVRLLRKLTAHLRKTSFCHSAFCTHLRFYLKVLMPHPVFLFKRYDKAYRKKLPKFYASLNLIQIMVLVFVVMQLLKYPLQYSANKTYFESHYQVMAGKLVQAGCYVQKHNEKCSVFVLGDGGKKFHARFDGLPKNTIDLHELRHHLQKNAVVEYIELPKAKEPLLLSLEVSPDDTYISPRTSLLSFDQSIAGYSRTTLGVYAIFLIYYLLATWWKYQRYGLRDYYRAIETIQSQPEESRLNKKALWLRCPKSGNTKPTKEMMREATRVGFFADEVLSQEITDSCDKTLDYIERHSEIHRAKLSKSPLRHFNRRPAKPIKASRLLVLMASIVVLIFYLPRFLPI